MRKGYSDKPAHVKAACERASYSPTMAVAVDSGNFMGFPSMYLSVPDCVPIHRLGLASAIGSAIARPDRLVVAALGDGGSLMGISELETAVRLGLPMVIAVYDDEAYGALRTRLLVAGGSVPRPLRPARP